MSAVVALALLSGSCSLLFTTEEMGNPDRDPAEICEGRARAYPRGAMLSDTRYRHVDYQQGTLTFWVRALEPTDAEATLLVGLSSGIAIAATPGGLVVQIENSGGYPIGNLTWEPGVDHFVSLRWDSDKPLSGTSGETAHVEVRVDQSRYLFADSSYAAAAGSEDYIIAGSGLGFFHVDQLVIYSRPLYVNDDSNDESDLFLMSESKSERGRVAEGGFDVLLATASPKNEGCDAYEAVAWTLPTTNLAPGNLQLGDDTGWSLAHTDLPSEAEVYPGGGFGVSVNLPLTASVDVVANSSYFLEVVTHSAATGTPRIEVSSTDTTPMAPLPILSFAGEPSDRENPLRVLLSFETGALTQVEIRLYAVDQAVAYDSVVVRPNLIRSGGFDEGVIPEGSPWGRDPQDADSPPIVFDNVTPYAAPHSACLALADSPNALTQEPERMIDHAFYLFGAQFLRRDGETPGVGIGNGSLFATGVPYESETKAGASIPDRGGWQLAGAVGRRLQDSQRNNHNDIIRFGSLAGGSGALGKDSDYCIDSAYTLALDLVSGSLPTSL